MRLTVEYELPPDMQLTSIHRKYSGEWIICVHYHKPGEILGLHHASAEGFDLNETLTRAVERATAKRLNPEPMKLPPVNRTGITLDLDL